MAEQPEENVAPPGDSGAEQDEKKKQKKKDKVRAAWISFTGRIVAQILGAAAAVALGFMVFRQGSAPVGKGGAVAHIETPAGERSAGSSRTRSPGQVALAVLPLVNLSADPRQEYFADGLTEALITELSHLEGLRVISRTSSMYYKGQKKTLPEIAQALGVDLIVEGSVLKDGGRVRISVQLIDTKSDEHLWARSYDKGLRDVLPLQAEVSAAIAQEVKVALTPLYESRLGMRRTVDPEVYDLYVQGRQAWSQRTPAGFQESIRFYEQALEKDPELALAHAGLADSYLLLSASVYGATAPRDSLAKARAAAERALALDDGLARAHTSMGLIRYRTDWDWAGADREFRRALELRPSYATGHQWYAYFLAEQGRDREATAEAERAVALDPFSPIMHVTGGIVHYYGRRYDRAAAAERRALELDPNSVAARLYLAWSLVAQNNDRAAIELLEPLAASQHPQVLATLAGCYTRAGDRKRAQAIRQQLLAKQPVPAAAQVRLHAFTGERGDLFRALDRAAAERSDIVTSLKVNALFDTVRTEQRFQALLRRLKLPN